jgi:spermidine synthase
VALRARLAVSAFFNARSHLAPCCDLAAGATDILSAEDRLDRLESLDKYSDRELKTNQQRRQVLSLASPFLLAPGTVRVLEPHEGASDFVRRGDWPADILLVDAFDRDGVAPSLASGDFYAHAFRCLRPTGLLVMNLAGERARYVAHLERLCEACPGPVLQVPVATDGNVFIFAFAQQTQAWTFESLEWTPEELQSEFALEFPRFLYRLRTGDLL